jgi:hypothetical protein
MSNFRYHLPFSVLSACWTALGVLVVSYIGLIAVVMSYAALTVEFTQSVKSDEAVVARLESQYLDQVARVTNTDYAAAGYTKPEQLVFVREKSRTALR